MSTDNHLWMGDIKPWMDESFILKAFNFYNIHPLNVKLIHDRLTNELKSFCFINFETMEEANNCLITLNGKPIPNTQIKFKLNWANYFSSYNKSVYVGNLNPDVDDISLYKLFKERYSSVLHATVITDKGKSKGFGFILFKGEKEYEKCLNEMNGIIFHGNPIKVNEQRKKDNDVDNNDDTNNSINSINNNTIKNFNNINNNKNNELNNLIYLNKIKNNRRNNYSNNNEQNPYIYQNYNANPNIINNIININKINNINYIDEANILYHNSQINVNNMNINPIIGNNKMEYNISNNNNISPLFINNKFENNIINSEGSNRILENKNSIIKNNINQIHDNIKKKENNQEYKLEILNKYGDSVLKQKIKENLEKMYNYYAKVYPGDINKLKCKLNNIIN